MSRRKGELTIAKLQRASRHSGALPAKKVRGLANSETLRGFAGTLSVAPLRYLERRADSAAFVVFCFKRPDDAQVFAERFGGERLPLKLASFHQLRLKVNQSDGRGLDRCLNAGRRTQLDSGIVEMKIDGTLR
jgi:hypothetical protein